MFNQVEKKSKRILIKNALSVECFLYKKIPAQKASIPINTARQLYHKTKI